jgi:hypothetical protein
MAHVNVYPSHISPTPMGNRPFPESSLRTTSANLLCFLPMSMIHRRSMIIVTMWSFYLLGFFDAEHKRVGHNFSCRFLVKMPSSF